MLILTSRIQTDHENSDISTTSGQCRQRSRQFRQPPTHYENIKMSNPKMYELCSVHHIGDISIDFRTRGLCCVYSRIESVVEAASVARSSIIWMTPSGYFNAYRNDPELHTVYSLIYFRTFLCHTCEYTPYLLPHITESLIRGNVSVWYEDNGNVRMTHSCNHTFICVHIFLWQQRQ